MVRRSPDMISKITRWKSHSGSHLSAVLRRQFWALVIPELQTPVFHKTFVQHSAEAQRASIREGRGARTDSYPRH